MSKKNLITVTNAIDLFLRSRRDGISPRTKTFYAGYLNKSIPVLGLAPVPEKFYEFFSSLSCSIGGKHAYYRAISVFFNWLYSPKSGFGFNSTSNPISSIDPPKRPKIILPSLTKDQVFLLIDTAHLIRDKAIISLFTESGLRLSELLSIKPKDIDWDLKIIKVMGKGSKEGYAPFGELTEKYLKKWLDEYKPQSNQSLWNIRYSGLKSTFDELKKKTGLPCNPHTFRRTFACLLRKAGIDSLTIKDLGRWESIEMVQRYTKSFTFNDSLKLYKAPLSTKV
jgi:integrase